MEGLVVLRMARKRWKRKSGYVTPNLTISKKELIKKVHGGMASVYNDSYEKKVRMNNKQKRLLRRRKARK